METCYKSLSKSRKYFFNTTNTSTPIKWYEGVMWSNLNNFQKANNCFQESLNLNPSHLQSLNNLASTFTLLGNFETSKKYYYKTFEISPLFYDAIIT